MQGGRLHVQFVSGRRDLRGVSVMWITKTYNDYLLLLFTTFLCLLPPYSDDKGNPMAVPPLIKAITKHPLLSKVKLIAEPWDLGMYQVGLGDLGMYQVGLRGSGHVPGGAG